MFIFTNIYVFVSLQEKDIIFHIAQIYLITEYLFSQKHKITYETKALYNVFLEETTIKLGGRNIEPQWGLNIFHWLWKWE